ncbi:MAG TPA: pyridoxal phosphate-dependent aminotransferase [Victivallales bacterium]|nr:pyridoxal phosphate-dependent aminotransferase [Victivallales bacterium]
MSNSKRILCVQEPVIPIVGQLISENPGTISLGQGIVHYSAPQEVFTELKKDIDCLDINKYYSVGGITPLVELLKDKLSKENDIRLKTGVNDVLVSAGANMAFFNTILTFTDPGDEIILLSPYYFNYEMAVKIIGCKPVIVPTDRAWQPNLDFIKAKITAKTKAVVTISPNNPTGAVYTEAVLRKINTLCKENNLYHISDEAYEYFTYDGCKHFSPGSIADSEKHTISIYSLSKAYGMAGWRIGYVVLPDHLANSYNKVQDTDLICPPVISQYAAINALKVGVGYCKGYLREVEEIRNMFIDRLKLFSSKISYVVPEGAIYFLLKINTDMSAFNLTEKLIKNHKVAVIPGLTFGLDDGCYIRIGFAALHKDSFEEGLGRLLNGIDKLV